DPEFMRTQYELLQGRTLAERVASTLKLGDDPTFFQPRQFSIIRFIKGLFVSSAPAIRQVPDGAARNQAAAGIVLGNRMVRPLVGSRLVDVTYSDPDPGRAQKIAAAFA